MEDLREALPEAWLYEEATTDEARRKLFLKWLKENGAKLPKLKWPVAFNGVRGVQALEAIEPQELFLEIPEVCWISEASCLASRDLRQIYQQNPQIFFNSDDKILSLFLVHERLKGRRSFYYPYLNILPRPETLCDWTSEEIELLQAPALLDVVHFRKYQIQHVYEQMFTKLNDKYDNRFPTDTYTLTEFQFAWHTIQSRSFGRRLPFTALIPFADLLNHANVAIKYDSVLESIFTPDVQANVLRSSQVQARCFRMFYTHNTRINRFDQVFNSYGRKSNTLLMLDYAFCMESNEWNTWDYHLPKEFQHDCDRLLRAYKQQLNDHPNFAHVKRCPWQFRFQHNQFDLTKVLMWARLGHLSTFDIPCVADADFTLPLNVKNERLALWYLHEQFVECLKNCSTSPEQDQLQYLQELEHEHRPRCLTALLYRIEQKQLIQKQLMLVQKLQKLVECQLATEKHGDERACAYFLAYEARLASLRNEQINQDSLQA